MAKYTLEQKFKTLCQITRASHFEWRETFQKMYPDADIKEAVLKYWEVVGHDTAKAYLRNIDRTKPIAPQIAEQIVDSSLAMGETAEIIKGDNDLELYVEHNDCPWLKWHQKYNAEDEDRIGCDKWFATIVDDINKELGTSISFETLSTLPDGDKSCKRIFKENKD